MNEPDSNFDALRKLLALKRHEVPPPGYFNKFSDQIVTRIRRGDTDKTDSFAARLAAEAPWLFSLVGAFRAKPAFAGVFASALCLLLVAGIVYTDNPGVAPDDLMPTQASVSTSSMASASPGFMNVSASSADLGSSTNPVLNLDLSGATYSGMNPPLTPATFTH